jgi:hypothetical protein
MSTSTPAVSTPPAPSSPSLGDQIYSGSAEFGVIWALIGAIIATIIGVCMIIVGIYILVKKSTLQQVSGTVVSVDPPSCGVGSGNPTTYSCNITVSYLVNTTHLQKIIWYSGSVIYSPGQSITVYYNPSDPGDASLSGPVPHFIGGILILFGLLIPIGSWFWYYMSRRYKFVAAAEGMAGAYSLITGR